MRKCGKIFEVPDLKAHTQATGKDDYTITLTTDVAADGKAEQAFKRTVFEWEGNKFGLSDIVPAPFTPVKVERCSGEVVEKCGGGEVDKVSVVLRDHFVDKKTGLWKQVMAAGKPLLARPMRFVEKVGGESRSTAELATSQSNNQTIKQSNISSSWDFDGFRRPKLAAATVRKMFSAKEQ